MEHGIEIQTKRFNLLSSEIDAAYHEAALKLGLSDSAMLILYTICSRDGECLLSDIMQMSGANKQTINSALRKLEAEDIVYLEAFSGKKKKVYLTDKGNQVVKNTVLRLMKIENDIYTSWTKEEWETYVELTQRYLNMFKDRMKDL